MTEERTCERCEYFDRGSVDALGESDCLNRMSPRFQTRRGMTCRFWLIYIVKGDFCKWTTSP